MADADVGQRVQHGIGDGHRGRQRGQLAKVSRVKAGVLLALGKA